MNIVALDLSLTGTGVCSDAGTRTISNKKLKDEARIDFIWKDVAADSQKADLVIVEGLAFATQTGKASERAGLWWFLKMMHWYHKVPVAVCPPTVLKKWATGKGNADKDEVMLTVARLFPSIAIKNNNEADATAMYAMAKERVGEALITLPKLQSQALEKVQWPEGF